jgi:hypothetical protein
VLFVDAEGVDAEGVAGEGVAGEGVAGEAPGACACANCDDGGGAAKQGPVPARAIAPQAKSSETVRLCFDADLKRIFSSNESESTV